MDTEKLGTAPPEPETKLAIQDSPLDDCAR